jgi:nucleotide-binding universal stress UspA family protein
MSDIRSPLVLAACDGADRGRQAVVLGRALARRTGSRLLIAAVYPFPGLPFPPPFGHRVDERRPVEQAIRAVRDELAPEAPTVVVPGFSPAHAICDLAQERGASTIVVGSRHLARRWIGDADHALQVLRSAHVDVLVAPDDRPAATELRSILVGFDGGPGSYDAMERAVELARATGAEITVLSVVPREMNAWWIAGEAATDPETFERWDEERRDVLTGAAQEALRDADDVAASCRVVTGDAARELVAASEGADLLVLGSRRWGTLARLTLGSVSEPVVRAGGCPTLVVARRHRSAGMDEPVLSTAARG